MKVTSQSVLRVPWDVDLIELDQPCLVSQARRSLCRLSPEASFFVSRIDGRSSIEDICGAVVREYQGDTESILHENLDLASTLVSEGFLESVNHSPHLAPVPQSLTLEVTKLCNLKCPFCSSNSGEDAISAKISDALEAVGAFSDMGALSLTLTGGEPTLRLDITLDLARYARSCGMNVGILTNGTLIDRRVIHLLRSAEVSWVQVSLNGPDPMSHDMEVGVPGSFERTMDAIVALNESGIETSVSSVITATNFRCMDDLVSLHRSLEVASSQLIYVQPVGKGIHFRGLLTSEQIAQTVLTNLVHVKSSKQGATFLPRRKCSYGLHPYVSAAGDIYPCTSMENSACRLGSLSGGDVKELWRSNALWGQPFDVDLLDTCRQCRFKYLCAGGCRGHSCALSGSPSAKDDYVCAANSILYRGILSSENDLANEVGRLVLGPRKT